MELIVGLVLIGAGILIVVIVLSALVVGKRADQDYESEFHDPDNTRMDRQDGRYAGPAARPTPGL